MANSLNRPMTGAQRVSHALNRANSMNQPIYCEDCGSVFFVESQASMYAPGANTYRSVSQSPMKVFTCLCGKVQTPPGYNSAAPAGSERGLYGEALTYARDFQEARSLDSIAQNTVSVAEHRRVVAALENLTQRFNAYIAGEEVSDTAEVFVEDQDVPEEAAVPDSIGDRLPIATGSQGRSAASAAPAGTDGTRWVEAASRPSVAGGARGRMKRQGE